MHRSIRGANTCCSPVTMNDLINLAVDQDAPAPLLNDLSEGFNNAVDAALRVPNPICNLQICEGRIYCRHARRISANEERVEPECLLHMRLLEELANPAFKEADRIKLRHCWEELDEVGKLQEVLSSRDQDPLTMNLARGAQEVVELRCIRGREFLHLGTQSRLVAPEIKVSIFARPEDAVARLKLAQRDVIRHLLARSGEDLFEKPWHGDQCGSRVEGVAPLADARGAPANLAAGLEDGDLPAVGEEANCRGEAAEAASHDERPSPLWNPHTPS